MGASSYQPAITKEISLLVGTEVSSLHRISRIIAVSPQPFKAARKSNPRSPGDEDRSLAAIHKRRLGP
jgi:hypothetical protein